MVSVSRLSESHVLVGYWICPSHTNEDKVLGFPVLGLSSGPSETDDCERLACLPSFQEEISSYSIVGPVRGASFMMEAYLRRSEETDLNEQLLLQFYDDWEPCV